MSGQPNKVVMLVDNDVRRDSRVQKQARSMAERGWEVTLLGINRTEDVIPPWKVGDATVELVDYRPERIERAHLARSPRWRDPLAYRTGARANQLFGWCEAQARVLEDRRRSASGPERVVLSARVAANRALASWRGFRRERTIEVRRRRHRMQGLVDRLSTAAWMKVLGTKSWNHLDPNIESWDEAFAPAIDRLRPDLIHANDFRMLFVAARATFRARAAGRDVKLVWDAHEFMPGVEHATAHPRWIPSLQQLEAEHAQYADAVLTVSDPIADLLQEHHHLPERPTIVLNTPIVQDPPPEAPSVRARCGLADEVPLIVYSGYVDPNRGVGVVIESLGHLPDLHVALVVGQPDSPVVLGLQERAAELGAAERLHILPYVPVEQIVPYLSSATLGVHSLIHMMNHEISLATKFYEYSQARLPIVGSDVRFMAETIRRTGQGEVFRVGDVDDFVRAVRAVLADRERYVAAYDQPGLLDAWTWEHQADAMHEVYRDLVGFDPAVIGATA